LRRLLPIFALLSAVPALGTLGFMLIERWDFLDALYMAVTTITTVGFGEVHPLSRGGRIFVIAYLVIGLGLFTYGLINLGERAFAAGVQNWLSRRHMDSAIGSMRDHVIVCGFGRMGRAICRRLAELHVPFVVIDRSDEVLAECRALGWPWLAGDATDDATLRAAHVEQARALAAVFGSDADNVYLTLSARLLVPGLQVIARASDEAIVPKLKKAGASRVVGLYDTGAAKIAQLMINPHLDQLITIFEAKGLEVDLAEIEVTVGAPYAGKTLDHTDFHKRGVTVVAVRRPDGQLLLPPSGDTLLHPRDRLFALGRAESIAALVRA